MKKKFKIFCACAVIVFSSWYLIAVLKVAYKKPTSFFEAIHRSADKAEPLLKKKYGLYAMGRGHQNPRVYKAGFFCYHETTVENARELMLKAAQEYLIEAEKNPDLPQFLIHPTLTSDNLDLCILFFTPDQQVMPPGKISCVGLSHGNIKYKIHDPDRPLKRGGFLLKTVHTESYDEAVKLIFPL